MFYAVWLVCIMTTQQCREIKLEKPTLHKTEETCAEEAKEVAVNVYKHFISINVPAQIGYKCVLDKEAV